jgi:hypothetical protein
MMDNSKDSAFYIKEAEIESLFSLQSYLLLPLWIAFISTNSDKENFHLVPIAVIKNYKDRLKEKFYENANLFEYLYIRIPNYYCKEISEQDDTIAVKNSCNFNDIDSDTQMYLELSKGIKNIASDLGDRELNDYWHNHEIKYLKYTEVEKYLEIVGKRDIS